MASILSRFSRSFRTRDPSRDAATDTARIAAVRAAIESAIADARRERDGLERRVEEHYTQAAFMLDDAPDYAERSAEEEQGIADAERAAAAAQRRIESIEAQIGQLTALLQFLDSQPSAADAA